MISNTKMFLAISLLTLAPAAFACDYPARIDIPNGLTVTQEEMLIGQRAVKAYVANMEIYLECIVAEEKLAIASMDDIDAEDEQVRVEMLDKKYNAAIDEMEMIAAQFNAAVQAYHRQND